MPPSLGVVAIKQKLLLLFIIIIAAVPTAAPIIITITIYQDRAYLVRDFLDSVESSYVVQSINGR